MYLRILLLLCLASFILCNRRISMESIESLQHKISKAQDDLEKNKFSPRLSKIIQKMPSLDTRSALEVYACNACIMSIDEFLHIRRIELFNGTYLMELAIEMCAAFEIQREHVCRGFVEFYAPSIIYIVDNRPDLTAETVCKFLLNDGYCSNPHNDDNLEFTVAINEHNPHESDKNEVETPEILSTNSSSTEDLIIVHLTDIHVDMKYKVGALANCKEYACCRDININAESVNASYLAGYWGDYRSCDTPFHAIEDAFHHIVKQHPKIDAIYFTGDIVDHFMWDTTIDGMKESLKKVYGLMRSVFKDIPIYPIIGNHEAQNLFAPVHITPSSLSTEWLYDHFAEIWADKLSTESIETIKSGGYYTTLVKPGLRLIALNNNLCYIYNFWVLYDVEQIREQFQWLHDTLLDAEQAGEKVHILSHVPNGLDEVHEPCSREYQRLIERFKKTIVAQFNGHTEIYGFHLFYESANILTPISIAFNGGSLASFSSVNRNYVVYNVDAESYEVKEADVWTYNLTRANEQQNTKNPYWFKQPSLRESFNLPDLTPSTLNNFVMKMMQNLTIFKQFWHMQIKNSDDLLEEGCDYECYRDSICEIIVSDNTNISMCKNLMISTDMRKL